MAYYTAIYLTYVVQTQPLSSQRFCECAQTWETGVVRLSKGLWPQHLLNANEIRNLIQSYFVFKWWVVHSLVKWTQTGLLSQCVIERRIIILDPFLWIYKTQSQHEVLKQFMQVNFSRLGHPFSLLYPCEGSDHFVSWATMCSAAGHTFGLTKLPIRSA